MSDELLGVKVEIEYDPAYQRWYVWEARRFFFFSPSKKLITSGETRDDALQKARNAIQKGLLKHSEVVEI